MASTSTLVPNIDRLKQLGEEGLIGLSYIHQIEDVISSMNENEHKESAEELEAVR